MGLGTSSFSAPRAVIIFNGAVCGTIQSANWTIDYGVKPIYEIDRVVPREIMPGTYSCSFRISGVKVMAQNFDETGLTAAPGTNYLQPYITFALLDRLTNVPLVNIEAGMITNISFDVSEKSVMKFDLAGVGFAALNDLSIVDSDSNPPKPEGL